ncbi:hypothetical protein C4J90_2956 [Pseudomonas sp. R2-60-08W]|nr:hypothetical protein C4J91_3057 [Pseudomonas sp. R3-52-08]AZF27127.1 hypothetical protein C4J90_2956 [Pseudomonas sp. R2-60-08W]
MLRGTRGIDRQPGSLEPQAPFIGAVRAQQCVFQQVGRRVQLFGDIVCISD